MTQIKNSAMKKAIMWVTSGVLCASLTAAVWPAGTLWADEKVKVSTLEELKSAVSQAASGTTISLSNSVELNETLVLNPVASVRIEGDFSVMSDGNLIIQGTNSVDSAGTSTPEGMVTFNSTMTNFGTIKVEKGGLYFSYSDFINGKDSTVVVENSGTLSVSYLENNGYLTNDGAILTNNIDNNSNFINNGRISGYNKSTYADKIINDNYFATYGICSVHEIVNNKTFINGGVLQAAPNDVSAINLSSQTSTGVFYNFSSDKVRLNANGNDFHQGPGRYPALAVYEPAQQGQEIPLSYQLSNSANGASVEGNILWEADQLIQVAFGNGLNLLEMIVGEEPPVVVTPLLEEMRGKDITVVLKLKNDASWSIYGKSVTSTNNFVDMAVTLGEANQEIPSAVQAQLEDSKAVYNLQAGRSSAFPFTAELTLPLGKEQSQKTISLYEVNKEKGNQLTLHQTATSDIRGDVAFSLNRGGNFVLSVGGKLVPLKQEEKPTDSSSLPSSESAEESSEVKVEAAGAGVTDMTWEIVEIR